MVKQVLIGILPALLIFLLFLGINVLPLFLFGMVIVFILFMIGRQQDLQWKSNSKSYSVINRTGVTFEQIGGQQRAKQELKEALDFLIRMDDTRHYGIRPLKGILLTGPPGTGKTLMAKAAASYTDSAFVAASGSQFVEKYVGVGAQRIRQLFKQVKEQAQKQNQESGIIFIDEIDVLGGKREGQSYREYDQTLNQLLTEMDGISTSAMPRILVIAATNRKDMLDDALLRPGRFDRHIVVDMPDKRAREEILQIHVKNKPLADDVYLEKIAEETFGFSGAQLESVANEAAIYAFRERVPRITSQHFAMAIDKVMMGERVDREATEEERKRVGIHELGHAVVSEVLRPGSVSQVALHPRGQALGYVRQNPQKDQYLYSKAHLEEQIMIALAGAVAEELIYGHRSTGSKNDFDQALRLVHTIIDSGLSSLGIVKIDMVNKEALQKESNAILDELLVRTRKLLEQYRNVLDQSCEHLLSEEVLDGEAFRRMLNHTSVKKEA